MIKICSQTDGVKDHPNVLAFLPWRSQDVSRMTLNIGIGLFESKITNHELVDDSLIQALDAASKSDSTNPVTCRQPLLRPWHSTLRIAQELKENDAVPDDFISLIQEDLTQDDEVLKEQGFQTRN
jgi:hypothetical protein